MKIKEVTEGIRWVKKHGRLVKVNVPDSPAEIQAKAMRQAMAEPKKEPLALKPIPNMDWEDIERIVDRTGMPLGGEIADIVIRKPLVVTRAGKRVAALKLVLYVSFNIEDLGYTDAEIEKMGGQGISDAVTIYLYRSPKNPRIIKADYRPTSEHDFNPNDKIPVDLLKPVA